MASGQWMPHKPGNLAPESLRSAPLTPSHSGSHGLTRAALTLAGPGAGRAGLRTGAPSRGAGAASPEQDLQRRPVLAGSGEAWAGPEWPFLPSPRSCPGHSTHPGRTVPAGKWQRQWKAAAQCAHRSASAPSPHTPHRAPGAWPCRRGRANGDGERGFCDPTCALCTLRPAADRDAREKPHGCASRPRE
jgi:hypothetical protein